ncbi:THO complex subunit 4A isoform X1 [Oryza sativa Japonica Group]|uniref:THO complex subunit 4A isoform X1 n=1 Tax=Oryza sativa subsp. japonica TaxID=39947 RepID=UPI000E1C1571|nr:THO complex subunit 4D isoform X1 [Oryza sativa Japonica Group]
MSSGLDMSLDDLIKQSKTKPKGGAPSSSGPTRRAAPPAARAAPYPPAGPKAAGGASPYGVYSEHVAAMAGVVPRPRPPPAAAAAAARSLETGTKLHISNLDPGVTVDDVQELFSEIGELKRYSVNYDKDGKSQGTAEVVFARKVDALEAIKRYDGVILDGNPMKIDLIGNNSETSPMPPTAPLLYNPPFPNYPNRTSFADTYIYRIYIHMHSQYCYGTLFCLWEMMTTFCNLSFKLHFGYFACSVPRRGGQRGQFHQGNGRPGNSQGIGGGPRGFQGSGRPGSGSQGGGGCSQGKTRGNERSRIQKSAADLDAELDQYHAEAVKEK